MKTVKNVKMTGFFNVSGIVNYNGKGEREGHKNYLEAKKDLSGRDFTSSNCLRQAMFVNLVPRQPGSAELKDTYPTFIGTFTGLIRGGMDAGSAKRKSPLTLLSAYSVNKEIFYEQKLKNSPQDEEARIKADGKEAKNTILFGTDSAPLRQQTLKMAINIKDLQTVTIGKSEESIKPKDVDAFLASASKTLKALEVSDVLVPKILNYIGSDQPYKVEGILFSDEQIAALVNKTLILARNIEINKTGAELSVDNKSLKVQITYSDSSSQELDFDDAIKTLKSSSFQKFWE